MTQTENTTGNYYDKNTQRFLDLGHGGKQLAIHRAVWGPGTTSRHDALHYVHAFILREIGKSYQKDQSFLDLGCGVGGSLIYLSGFLDLRMKGMSISPVQVDLAKKILIERDLDRIEIFQGDYLSEDSFRRANGFQYCLNYESLLHAPHPQLLVELVSKHLESKGLWFVCDDFLNSERSTSEVFDKNKKRIDQFKKGWHAPQLLETDQFESYVQDKGFIIKENIDLTSYLELERPRDRFISLFVGLTQNLNIRAAWFENLLGGNALQKLLLNKILNYRFYILQKS